MTDMHKIVKVSLSDQIAERLRKMIAEGEFPVGSKLPSEGDLASTFGVSRLTVRMALQKLNTQGLTATRPGDGTFVKKFSIDSYLDEVSEVVMKPEMLDDVLEFRFCIEGEAVKLAMDRMTQKDLDRLDQVSAKLHEFEYDYERPNAYNIDEYVALDFKFHLAICKCSHNSLLVLAYTAAKAPICAYLKAIGKLRIRQYQESNPDAKRVKIEDISTSNGHESILNALKNRDLEAANQTLLRLANYTLPLSEVEV